ncbi:hypothetical protein [Nocardia sp. NPDC057272]|uniref:hypothetical protein n=1 Tax=Nocardia sp. NPDC057272 TaxID=3346079 RepID=UPI00363F3FC9
MGLSVGTGGLAFAVADGSDPEYLDALTEQLRALSELLVREGLAPHDEPRAAGPAVDRARIGSVPYSFVHYLRRAYARAREYPEQPLTPVADGDSASDDPAIDLVGSTFDSHLICHSDCEGFYVPVDFDEVLFVGEDVDIAGGMVGSSTALMRELVYVAPYLGIELVDGVLSDAEIGRIRTMLDSDSPHPFDRELITWLLLFEAARVSIENGTVVEFG